jgi:carboxylate-amine ligase
MVSSLIHRRGATPNPSNPLFGFGIEEEYFLACADTMAPAIETPQSLFERPEGPQFQRELLQAQLEVATRPQGSAGAARRELKQLRLAAAEAASEHGLVILAAGTHPLADWRQAIQSPKQRYQEVMDCLQMLGRRNMLCAMHVHVELPDPSQRVDVMVRMLPYLPLLLALSTSSPFWGSQRTGLKGYRLAAYDELPRTGLPEMFSDEREYQIYLDAMMRSGAISDASHVWWSIRPAQHYPTLELRATDCCTRIDDAIAIASLYRAIVRHLYLNPDVNRGLNAVDRAIAAENKWRAQRYGIDASFVSRGGAVPIADVLKDICVQIAHDIEALDCVDEIYHCHSLLSEGTSADAQLRICEQYEDRGMSHALRAVCRWIADATLAA